MRDKTKARATIVLAGVALFTLAACYSIDQTAQQQPRLAAKGEACMTTAECAADLVCAPGQFGGTGVCDIGKFNLTPTGKQCAFVQCRTNDDCCAGFPPGSTCTEACQNGTCMQACKSDTDCFGKKCTNGVCQQCANASDCGGAQLCHDGQCVPKCTSDSQCAGFDRCVSGTCVKSGCQNDYECIAATGNVEATCASDGGCEVACKSDIECSNPRSFRFFACLDGSCVDVGCQSDKDCSLRRGTTTPPPGSGSIAVCK